MPVSFSLIDNVQNAAPVPQIYRMRELGSLVGLKGNADGSGGGVAAAVRGGVHSIDKPSVSEKGVLFLLSHHMTLDPSSAAIVLYHNMVMLNGQGYMTVTRLQREIYTPVSIQKTTINVSAMMSRIVPRNVTTVNVGAPGLPSVSQMDDLGPPEDNYNTVGNAEDNYNNMGGNPSDNYNNVNPAFAPPVVEQYMNVKPKKRVRFFGI